MEPRLKWQAWELRTRLCCYWDTEWKTVPSVNFAFGEV